MSTFDDRENAFENKFAHDAEMQFKAEARRNRLLGLWAAELLGKVDTVIFHGVNWNRSAEAADIVLPGATDAEKDGTFTSFEGRIQRFHQALLPIEEARNDIEILADLAKKLGVIIEISGEQAFEEWQGLTHEGLGKHGTAAASESPAEA